MGFFNMFFRGTFFWRWDHDTQEFDELTAGEGQYMLLQRKMLILTKEFIRDIFSYEQIDIIHKTKATTESDSKYIHSSSPLTQAGAHSEKTFTFRFFNAIHTVTIINLPISKENSDIEIFFYSVVDYLNSYYTAVESNKAVHELGHILASEKLILISDIFLYNLRKSIIIEYLHRMFNVSWEKDGNISYQIKYNKKTLDLLCTIHDFAVELSTRQVENDPIYTGFIFTDDINRIYSSIKHVIDVQDDIPFGNFKAVKSFLKTTNGRDIFFIVSDRCIKHIVKLKTELVDNSISLSGDNLNTPLIVSIQGLGKISYYKGNLVETKKILDIENSKYSIKDSVFGINRIINILHDLGIKTNSCSKSFTDWILNLSKSKHGTTILVGGFDKKLTNMLVKTTPIATSKPFFKNKDNSLLDHLTQPDGAIVFNEKLAPLFIASILPFSNCAAVPGGARHNSALNFTKEHNCIGIVVSEDGPITIMNNGEVLLKV